MFKALQLRTGEFWRTFTVQTFLEMLFCSNLYELSYDLPIGLSGLNFEILLVLGSLIFMFFPWEISNFKLTEI